MADATVLPATLALISAFLFGLGAQFSRLGLRYMPPASAALIQIGTAAVLYWLFAPLFVEAAYWLAPAILLFAAIGLFRPLVSSQFALVGTKYLGPTVSSTLSGTSPLFGVALGVLVLGEGLTPAVLIGTAGIMVGVVVLTWRGNGAARDWPVWALALPIGAALIRAGANMFAKLGMETIANPYFVGLVGYTVAAVAALALSRDARRALFMRNPGVLWLMVTGTVYAIAVLALNTALLEGRLIVVAPIVACSPVITLLLGKAVFREEMVDRRVIAAVALVVPSVVLITLRG